MEFPYSDLIHKVQMHQPDLLALYAFGSRISGGSAPDSDLDLALLVPGKADPVALWHLASDLADIAGCPVDLLDLRAASTVMQYRIITTGQRLWARDARAALYESFILSEKTALDEARAPLLAIIAKEGIIHGR
ncbi:MAG: nucleotidyltransferase domain-containing protein [Magnetococcales bacterium]|nr:nucleotidyltransferase domain-containing protein [Magnetococcales bacterium]MBF0148519.1 nucleotidyltransferase domain-containing protein [Magnetococcales bacterium]MBF0629790.1 nucleotidyltransferase domain-containing protein [Magnetococcales bacterium]